MANLISGSKPYWHSPLHEQTHALAAAGAGTAAVQMGECPRWAYVIVRGRVTDAAFVQAASSVLGATLPQQAKQVVSGSGMHMLWLSPDEWLVVGAYPERDQLLERWQQGLHGVFAQVVDNSGGFTALAISGAEAETVLRHVTPYDVASIGPRQCAATVMAKASMVLVRQDATQMLLICRRSFADYIWRLLQQAARPYGWQWQQPVALHDPAWQALCVPDASI